MINVELLIKNVCEKLNLKEKQVKNTINLIEEGNTIPFIARYRKEVTNNLDEEQIFEIQKEYDYQVSLEEKKEKTIEAIKNKGKLTDEIIDQINKCTKLVQLDNIYKPYVEKKKTRAGMAIKLGLEPLAKYILSLPKGSIKEEVEKYIKDDLKYQDAINGAKDIIAEIVADDYEIRELFKASIFNYGFLKTKLKNEQNDIEKKYKLYYDTKLKLNKIQDYKVMAINRAEKEKVITYKFEFNKAHPLNQTTWKYAKNFKSEAVELINEAINDGISRLLIPSVENEIWNELYEKAQIKSIDVFSKNLENILSQSPLKEKDVLGVDPAFRTGCKLAVVNKNNSVSDIRTIYCNEPHNKTEESEKILLDIINKNNIDIIAIGNGTASRETEIFINNFLKKNKLNIPHVIVSEAGASVYSASENARKEFPNLEVEKRSAISIARRIIDPLAELIKIDPKSIGVGQYQHDLPKKELESNLNFTIQKIVNRVGVDLNTASEELLKHISGINNTLAKSIIKYRNEKGRIKSREEIKNIPSVTKKIFEQSSGFLRIKDGNQILDETSIHPDNYEVAERFISLNNIDLNKDNSNLDFNEKDVQKLSEELNTSTFIIEEIVNSIKQQKRDYRDVFDAPLLRNDVLSAEDLKTGMELSGVIRNIVDFGIFIDIGIKNDALLHISNIKIDEGDNHYLKYHIGQILDVFVKKVDNETKKVEVTINK